MTKLEATILLENLSTKNVDLVGLLAEAKNTIKGIDGGVLEFAVEDAEAAFEEKVQAYQE